MTNDTKRALEMIAPIAKELNIDIKADGHFLYCNGQAIGIACNSTYATLNEFLGYAMYWSSKISSRYKISPNFIQQISQYWRSPEIVEEVKKLYD